MSIIKARKLSRLYRRCIPVVAGAVMFALAFTAQAQMVEPIEIDPTAPVNFQAKTLTHDEATQTVTATGDVELVQGDRILRADKVVYNLGTDTVRAIGNVSLLDANGAVHFAEYVELSRSLKDGFVHGLLSMLDDGSRFTAVTARREKGAIISMTEASYTPCKVCEVDPNPTWQIKADEVSHNEETKEIKYKNARLEILGIPLAWTPMFSHADPTVKRRSGLLRPNYGWTENTGTFVEGGYFFDIAPNKDATVIMRPTARAGILAQGEWRQRFENGKIKLKGSFVESDRREEGDRIEKDKVRGHIDVEGLFNINNKWRAGFDISRASDKEYLRLYDLSKENTLHSEIYAERFSGRDYSRIAAVNVQDLRLGVRVEQPDVVPMVEHHMIGEPQSLLKGRWDTDVSVVQLQRGGLGQDLQRVSMGAGWERKKVSTKTGVSMTYNAGVDGDVYTVQNNVANGGQSTGATRGRVYGSAVAGYPLVKNITKAQVIVEPVAGVNVSTYVDNDPVEFPDEDSADVQVDVNSLFATNRFPGADRKEDGLRVNYGMKAGLYKNNGRYAKAFVGQSYRFKDNDGLFPQGSGLDNHASDLVGQVSVGSPRLNADYRVQFDSRSVSARRHELQASGDVGRLHLDTHFIYLDAIAGTGFIEPREQLQVGSDYKLTDRWTFSTNTLMDFGEDPGLRRGSVALSYADECFSFAAQGTRNLVNQASGESGTVIMLRVGLKNIGEFSVPEITLKPAPEE